MSREKERKTLLPRLSPVGTYVSLTTAAAADRRRRDDEAFSLETFFPTHIGGVVDYNLFRYATLEIRRLPRGGGILFHISM
jgi:hypothetical protein